MTYSSYLAYDPRPLVLDTSVLVNLHACTYGERVLMAIPNEIIIPQIVANELEHETSRSNGEHSFLQGLVASGKVTLADMTDEEYELFAELTAGSPSLDDGEAATIAIAVQRRHLAVIDERKGRACATTLLDIEPGWSLDLLRHPSVLNEMGVNCALDALYLALRDGRMRVPSAYREDVLNWIGIERAIDCSSLPNFKDIQYRYWSQEGSKS